MSNQMSHLEKKTHLDEALACWFFSTDIKYFQIVKNLPEVWLNLIIKNKPIMTKKLTFIDIVHFFDFQVVFEQINFTKK